ncbi:uncharacterized protein LOC117295983 [Asterias rubens]|uniref:uncharacterized protein LOC117295983 n=1 Tax=Asterias rubens TaxID=7604 RepID=UPI00145590E5|nr:uncharacterized protein LOC117295983 [Asterias rubens]
MASKKELAKLIKADPTAIETYMPQVLEMIRNDEDDLKRSDDLSDALTRPMLKEVKTKKNKYENQMVELCQVCFEKRTTKYYELAAEMFKDKKIINWKERIPLAEKLIKTFEAPVKLIRTEKDDWWGKDIKPSDTEIGKAMTSCIEKMMEAFDRDKILKKVSKFMVEVIVVFFKAPDDLQIVKALAFVSNSWHTITWEGTENNLAEIIRAMCVWIKSGDLDLESSSGDKVKAINSTLESSLAGAGAPSKYAKELNEIFQFVLTQELDGEPYSGWGLIALTICSAFVIKHCGNARAIKDFIPGVMTILKGDCETLVTVASGCVTRFYQQIDLLAPCADDVIEVFLAGKSDMIGLVLKPLYAASPEPILSRFDKLAEYMEDMNQSNKTYMYMLWDDVAKDNAKLLVPYVDLMMGDVTNGQLSHQVLMVLGTVSIKFPELFVDKIDKLLRVTKQTPHTIHAVAKVVASVGQIDEKQADRCLKIFTDKLKTSDDMWISTILMEMKRVGRKYVEILKKYRAVIEPFKTSQQMGVPDLIQSLIDFMEGRSLETLADEVDEVKDDVKTLDTRVTVTEENVDRLDKTVTEQSQEIDNVKNEVVEQGERLDELEEVVDDTVLKVDEIDHKTITNAPKWSRDVSKLLNPEHEHDWRYLAIRLGFTGEDVRNWALSPDPTMALLAEWYTVHKSSEATYAVLTALQDMGREDASAIVEESLQSADALVPKAAPDMSEKPPRVFISYQWDHQAEVKVIKEHLEKAGFGCWLDIGQMGGGDSLFAKINDGMRAAKVVLCMCTEKYSKSENCNKEVNLANLLNKPIIPVLIEKTAWPPAGSMSMLFAQLLYIQLYNDKEYIRGDKFWEDAKFAELLGQISYHAAPDEDMITDEYRNWVPQIDDLPQVVKKADSTQPSTNSSTQNPATQDQVDELIPQVFISYQWDKQTEIKRLYSRLTSLGFSCWLDILQMGGGDPLYSKIDKGIRNAKVVVSSVTPKYALSANCRREVSLSDALRKPVIPILMEQMTWPPEGPMSMPFAQLLYIDFTKESTQKDFTDNKFDELLEKLKEHATVEELVIQQKLPAEGGQEEKTEEEPTTKNPSQTVEQTGDKQPLKQVPDVNHKEEAAKSPDKPERPRSASNGPQHAQVVQPERPKSAPAKPKKSSSVCAII